MWVSRDKMGTLQLFRVRPIRQDEIWYVDSLDGYDIDSDLFPDLKWEDEPIEVELTKVVRHFIQCDNCGHSFSYLPKDVNFVSYCPQPSSGYEEDAEYVFCPICRGKVFL